MTIHKVTYNPVQINFRPASELEEIVQNINTIIGTAKYTVPLNRKLGLSQTFIDSPMTHFHATYVGEIFDAVEEFEPRVLVEEVKFNAELDGRVYPTIYFRLREEVAT